MFGLRQGLLRPERHQRVSKARHIYAYFWRDGHAAYVGSTWDVKQRDYEHRTTGKLPFDTFLRRHGSDLSIKTVESVIGTSAADAWSLAVPRENFWMDTLRTYRTRGGYNFMRASIIFNSTAHHNAWLASVKAKTIDLTNKRFGKLLVLRIAEGKGTKWVCRCDCGAERVLSGTNLRRKDGGGPRGCRACKGTRHIDLVGQRFGRLQVTASLGPGAAHGQFLWLCRCDCGSELKISGSALRTTRLSGAPSSCGCARTGAHIIDLTGQRFGKLVVVKLDSVHEKHMWPIWLCRCDCGREKLEPSCYLRKKTGTRSCGCYNYQRKEAA